MADRQFIELARIPVRVGPGRKEGRLTPTFDGDMIALRSDVPDGSPSLIGVNVDGLLLLDALPDGTLFDVEVLVPASRWGYRDATFEPPANTRSGSIVLADAGPEIFVEPCAPPLFTVDGEGRLLIELEPIDAQSRWVRLSPHSFAILNGGFLAGFSTFIHR